MLHNKINYRQWEKLRPLTTQKKILRLLLPSTCIKHAQEILPSL